MGIIISKFFKIKKALRETSPKAIVFVGPTGLEPVTL
jgi:hypothetical protein